MQVTVSRTTAVWGQLHHPLLPRGTCHTPPRFSVQRQGHAIRYLCRANDGPSSPPAGTVSIPQEESVFYEGSGAPAELVISLLLGATLLYLPLTIASIGRRLWIKYKFTNRRLVVTTNSPVFQREVQIDYKQIKEIRTAPRAFGLWGDMVIFLKDGSRLELVGLERFSEIRAYILEHIQ